MIINEKVTTRDVGEAEELIGRVYQRGRFEQASRPFFFEQHFLGDDRATMARFRISSPAHVVVDLDEVLAVGRRRGGLYQATSNGVPVDPNGPFLLRPGEAQSWSEEMDLLMVNVDLRALAVHAGVEPGDTRFRFRFDEVGPVSPALARLWQHAVGYLGSVLTESELLGNDLVRGAAVDTLFSTVLAAFPVQLASRDLAARTNVQESAILRARRFIEDNAADAISVGDIARAARLSVRSLQAGFRIHLGATPTQYLRSVRLSAARRDLVLGDPSTTSVTAIAHRWGFHHLGRFARDYRAEYDENPVATLRR